VGTQQHRAAAFEHRHHPRLLLRQSVKQWLFPPTWLSLFSVRPASQRNLLLGRLLQDRVAAKMLLSPYLTTWKLDVGAGTWSLGQSRVLRAETRAARDLNLGHRKHLTGFHPDQLGKELCAVPFDHKLADDEDLCPCQLADRHSR
jgi:hypothetical protein